MQQVDVGPEQIWRISRARYERMVELGVFAEKERVELIHGIIVKMTPIGTPHASTVTRVAQLLILALRERASQHVRVGEHVDLYSGEGFEL